MNKSDYYIQKIRKDEFEKLTGSVSNNIPFLLFPVRIETHFRKGNAKSILTLNDTLDIYKSIVSVIDKVNSQQYDIIPQLVELKETIAVSEVVEAFDKPFICQLIQTLDNVLLHVMPNDMYEKADVYLKKIISLSNAIKVNHNKSYNKTTYFIKRLKKCLNYIKTLSDFNKLPYRRPNYFNVKEHGDEYNKKLYKYIEDTLDKSLNFLNIAPKMLDSLSSITGSQNVTIKRILTRTDTYFNLQNINNTLSNVYKRGSFQNNHIETKYKNDWNNKVNEIDEKINALIRKYYSLSIVENDFQEKFTCVATHLLKMILEFPNIKRAQTEWNSKIVQINFALKKCIYTSKEEYLFVKKLTSTLKQMLQPYSGYEIPVFVDKPLAAYNSIPQEIPAKELCVRIFPDEIFLDYLTEGLTEQEISDGKFFWMQWYIASGSEKREYEAWQVLCNKYEIHRAAWIVRCLRPENLDDFRSDAKYFYRRPYQNLEKLETLLVDICSSINKISLNEVDSFDSKTGEWKNEKQIREYLGQCKDELAMIDSIIMSYEYIVDYLFENISHSLGYIKRRLLSFISFYNKFPGKYGNNVRHMELWDVDHTKLLVFTQDVEDFINKISSRNISLEDMVNRYLNDPKHNYFVNTNIKVNKSSKFDIPTSNILPERFVFIGEESKNKKRIIHYGRKVKQNLQMGLDPNEDADTIPYKINENGELEVSGGINWMLDYHEAEKAGMAITVPLNSSITGFNYVYVLGIKDGDDKANLEELFNSHNYSSSGLEMLKLGTPTNLLDGIDLEGRNVYDTDKEKLMRSRYDIEVQDVYKTTSYEASDSYRMSEFLGMDYNNCWGHVNNSNNMELDNIEKANVLIWEYFFSGFYTNGAFRRIDDMHDDPIKKYTENDNVEEFLLSMSHFLKYYCKGSGMFAPFKIGDQPYGILPVTNFEKLGSGRAVLEAFGQNLFGFEKYEHTFIKQLNQILILLADRWKTLRKDMVNSAENLNVRKADDTPNDNTQTRYLKMAGLMPYSTTFYERQMIDSPLLPYQNRYEALTKTTFAKKLASVFNWKSKNSKPYSDFLESMKLFNSLPIDDLYKQISLSNDDSYPCPKWLSEIKTKLKKEIKGLSEREYNMLITQFFDLFTYRIDAWFMAILHYKYYSFGQLNYYRFVQLNGYAPQKFFYLDAPKIGAFGWVFNLKEKTRREIANKASIVNQMNLKDAQSPIYKNYDSDSDEYIMAPSVQHAITAAILRSSHRNSKSAVDEHRMSVNLSSMRARQALRLIDGIKSGMSTGVVLGIDLEGYMHNAYKAEFEGEYCEMSQYIYPLRKLFPQTIDIEAEDKRADNYVMQVINGEAILNTFKDKWNYQGSVFDYLCNNYSQMPELSWTANLFGNNHNHLRCLFKLIERMADSYDALSDLLLSEGVYRLVQGNRSAFASIINFMSKGSGNLPEPVILNTPMEHVVSQYRVGIALPECKQIIQRPMCIGEPSVNLWLEQMMGKSDNIYFIIKKKIEDKNIYEKCYLSEIDLNPIEYLYLSSDEDLFFTYLGMQYRLKNNNFTDELTILNSEPEVFEENDIREYELKNEDFSLFENELRINNLRSLILQSHSMKANDWIAQPTSDSEEENTIDINELKFRYESLVNYAKSLNLQMISLKNNLKEDYITDETLIEMSKLLSKNIEMGLTSSLSGFKIAMFADDIDKVANRPMFDRAVDLQQTFLQSFEFVQTQLEKRIEEVEEIIRQKDPSLFSSELYISAMQKLLLDTFKVYTRFTIHPATSIEQRESYNKILQQGVSHYKNISEMSFEEWTNDVAEVRDGMKKWNYIRMFENMCGNDLGKASIIQMKSEGDVSLDEWLGCEVSSESVLDDVDSLVIYNSENINIKHDTTYNSGIMIDSWLEYIPYKKQAAGMVFHCDQPDAEAPQTLLLAISPEFDFKYTKRWSLNNLIELVEETRFLAMNRAVEPDHIYKDSILSAILPLFSKKND